MSDTIRWSDTSDKEKTRLILDHVLGYFIMPDSTFKLGHFEMPSREEMPVGFHWPIAFWNSDVDLCAHPTSSCGSRATMQRSSVASGMSR